jgi:hypothetical protein
LIHRDARNQRSVPTQKLAGALSFNVEADGYRPNNRRKTLANSETENTKVYLCALRRRALLEKGRRYSWKGHVNEAVILRKFSRRDFPHSDQPR